MTQGAERFVRIQSREEETTLARWVLIDCSQVVPHSVEGESLCADTVTAQGAGSLTVLNAAPPSQHSQDDGAMQDASAKKRRKEAGAEIAPASAPQVSAQSSAADGAAAAAALPAAPPAPASTARLHAACAPASTARLHAIACCTCGPRTSTHAACGDAACARRAAFPAVATL